LDDWARCKGRNINGIVGAVDGIAAQVRRPGGEVRNAGAYYNRKGFATCAADSYS